MSLENQLMINVGPTLNMRVNYHVYSCVSKPLQEIIVLNQMKNKYHTFGIVPSFDRKFVERCKNLYP